MSELTSIKNNCAHIINELSPFRGDNEKLDAALDSVSDACESIEDDAREMDNDLESKDDEIKDLKENVSTLEQEAIEQNIEIDFDHMVEHRFFSLSGQMALFSSTLSDDAPLELFKTLAENIKTSELEYHLKNILLKYPALCKKLALPI